MEQNFTVWYNEDQYKLTYKVSFVVDGDGGEKPYSKEWFEPVEAELIDVSIFDDEGNETEGDPQEFEKLNPSLDPLNEFEFIYDERKEEIYD